MHPNRRPEGANDGGLRGVGLATLTACLIWSASGPVVAQGFGFLFGQPERGYRHRTGHRPRPQAVAVPMPPPRPHFDGDAPRETPVAPNPPVAPASPPAPTPAQDARPPTEAPPLPPEKPPELAKPNTTKSAEPIAPPEAKTPEPKPPLPAVAPSGATNAFNPRQPAEDSSCPGRLQATQVDAAAVSLGPQPDSRCVVVQPVKLDHLTLKDGGRIDFPDHPTLACSTADTFSRYIRELLVPLAKGTYGVTLGSVWTGPGLECRSRDHIFGAKLSAHGQGLAIDIAQLKLADGRMLSVGEPKSDQDQAFETAARAAGCGYFHTVLGPGSDSYHRTHWHFDLEERGAKGDSKYCK